MRNINGNKETIATAVFTVLLLGGRALDKGDWVTMTREFTDAAMAALKAAEAKNVDGIFSAGGDLNASCDHCHAKYQRQ